MTPEYFCSFRRDAIWEFYDCVARTTSATRLLEKR